jgi:hypothetical protein
MWLASASKAAGENINNESMAAWRMAYQRRRNNEIMAAAWIEMAKANNRSESNGEIMALSIGVWRHVASAWQYRKWQHNNNSIIAQA